MNIDLKPRSFYIPRTTEVQQEGTGNIGLGILVSYFTILFYSVYTSYIKTNKIGSSLLNKGKKNFTLSETVEYSEKSVVIFFSLLYMGLGLYISQKKNLFQWDFGRIIIISSFVYLPVTFISITQITSKFSFHYIIAIILFLGGVLTSYYIYELYDNYFLDNDEGILNTLYVMFIICLVFGILLTLIFLYKFVLVSQKIKVAKNIRVLDWLLTDLLAFGEFLVMVIYGIIIYTFSLLPKLP